MTNNSTIQLKDLVINVGDVKAAAKVLRSVNHKFRMELIQLLDKNGTMTVSDIILQTRTEQSVISQMLAILRKQNVVTFTRDGKWIKYELNYETLKRINTFVNQLNNQ